MFRLFTLVVVASCPIPLFAQSDDPSSPMVQRVAAAVIERTNEFRKENGLSAVDIDDDLNMAASEFAKFMAKTGKYGHRADGRTPAERAEAANYDYCVVRENIAYRTNTGKVTAQSLIDVFVEGWIDSPPHRENMLADYVKETGVAVATSDQQTFYAVQLFGRPKSAAIRVRITNLAEEAKTVIIEANDSRDEIEMPPRGILKTTRCFPTKLRLADGQESIRVTSATEIVIDEDGIERKDSPPK